MARTDRSSLIVPAARPRVYDALLSADALAVWLPPAGVTGRVLEADLRVGGGFTLELTFHDVHPGKTTASTDVTRTRVVDLLAPERVVWATDFDSPDPAFAGTMTTTWQLDEDHSGCTHVTVIATGVPAGIDHHEHELGLGSSLEHLAEYVEAAALQP